MSDCKEQLELDLWHNLIEDVKACPDNQVENRVQCWDNEICRLWINNGDNWSEVTDLLPVSKNEATTPTSFMSLLLDERFIVPAGVLTFLILVGRKRLLSDRIWTDQLGENAELFVAGCLNLLYLASKSSNSLVVNLLSELKSAMIKAVGDYPLTIVSLRLSHPELVVVESGSYAIANILVVTNEDMRIRRDDSEMQGIIRLITRDVQEPQKVAQLLIEMHIVDVDYVFLVLQKVMDSGVEPTFRCILDHLVRPFHREFADDNWGYVVAAAVEKCKFHNSDPFLPVFEDCLESRRASQAFCQKYEQMKPASIVDDWRKSLLELWGRYIPRDDAFAYCWQV